MSTAKDNNKSRKLDGKDFPEVTTTFGDVLGEYPIPGYENSSSVNHSARASASSNDLDIAATGTGIDLSEFQGGIDVDYPLNQVIETESGHVIEINDTKSSPRVLVKHSTGSGVDFRPDGSVVVNAGGNGLVEVATGGHKLIVTGEGHIQYSGNLTLDVGGDFNVNVSGAYNVQAKEETKTINGPSRDFYTGNKYSTVRGTRKDTYTEQYTAVALGGSSYFVKGDYQLAVDGGATFGSKGAMSSSSEERMTSSSPDINIGAESISVFGATGNIGGENVIMHNKNMFSGHSIWAGETVNTKTVTATATMNSISFHGDLYGTATDALAANVAAATGGGGASQTSGSDASYDTTGQNDAATSDMITEYANSNYGTKRVTIDKGDFYKFLIDKANDTGGVTAKPIVLSQIRAKKRDAGHSANTKFNNYAVNSKQMSKDYSDTVPPGVGEVRDPSQLTTTPANPVTGGDSTARVIPSTNKEAKISVDPQYDPSKLQIVTTATKLTKSISLAEFAYGTGDPQGLDKSMRLEQKVAIARNLIPHAQFVERIRNDKGEFKGYNLHIVEGLYIEEPQETITADGVLDLRTKGRAVVYELIGMNGVIDKDKTFELASWMAKNVRYDKLILDYDMYDPFGDMNVQIVMITPDIPASYEVKFKMETETLYNGKKQDSAFMRIQSEAVEPGNPEDSTSDTPSEEVTEVEPSDDNSGPF